MGFFSRLFGKSTKEENKTVRKSPAEIAAEQEKRKAAVEAEMLKNAIDFIRVNAEGEDGDADSQFQYGVMFATGQGPGGRGSFTKDIKQAIYWLNKSAAQGNLDAVAMLGRVYMDNGEPATAVKYYRKAAEQGHEAACENLAMAYGMGDGVPEDKAEAHKWFMKAAELGSAFAQYIAGNNYFNGIGVEENTDEAIKWFFKAAEQGQPNAQFEIGQLYEYGGQDTKTAREWYAKAAAQGHEEAQAKLKTLK